MHDLGFVDTIHGTIRERCCGADRSWAASACLPRCRVSSLCWRGWGRCRRGVGTGGACGKGVQFWC